MLALRPQARFGGQPGRKARLLGRRSSRGHCGGVGFRGRDESRPYESILCFGPTGKMRRRMVLREGHGPPLQTGVSIEANRETGFLRYNKPL